jgi:hypothetical protein
MSSGMHSDWPRWLRLSNHNPLYLVSAWLVLHGVSLAFQGDIGLRWIPLMTQLLCVYTLALALVGWLVVRVANVWEDARMILLVILLMFTALSTSYDDLCLKNPAAGALHLAIGFAFSCALTEWILFSLGMKLPLRYRAPFYLQLAVLFAFPAWLGKLSVDGHDPAMLLGVLTFPVAAAAALLTLWPAAAGSPQRDRDNGTPWRWPFYPWSIFVFVSIACGIRAWMLSLSFSPADGVAPAFLPYFLCPILIAMFLLALEMGLRQNSKTTQWIALIAMLGTVWMSFPGKRLNNAQQLLLNLMETSLAGPPLLVCVAVALIAIYAMRRRAAGSEFVAVVCLMLLAFLQPNTRSLTTLGSSSALALFLVGAWQIGYGLHTRSTLRLGFGGAAIFIAIGRQLNQTWLFEHNAYWLVHFEIIWFLMLPLYCRDALANWLRATGPFWTMAVATAVVIGGPFLWIAVPGWALAAVATAMALLSILYLATLRVRWYALAAAWTACLATVFWTIAALEMLHDKQLRHGLTFYALGFLMLAVALFVSLWKARIIARCWRWLQNAAQNGIASSHGSSG